MNMLTLMLSKGTTVDIRAAIVMHEAPPFSAALLTDVNLLHGTVALLSPLRIVYICFVCPVSRATVTTSFEFHICLYAIRV